MPDIFISNQITAYIVKKLFSKVKESSEKNII